MKDLAEAPTERVLKMWEGLGYYNRVRNLQKGAQVVMEQYGGQIPASFEELRKLPGIGDYTAGAIGSIAFQLPVPAVDGNVLRVISRVLCRYDNILDGKVKAAMEKEIQGILPQRVGDFNQSLMELGATVCLPGGPPKCLLCPLKQVCRGFAQGVAQQLPIKTKPKPRKKEERTVFLLFSQTGKLALRQRPEKGLLAGLWELPAVQGKLTSQQAADCLREWGVGSISLKAGPKAKQIFSHVEWHMTCWVGETTEEVPGFVWVSGEQLQEAYPLPSAFKGYFPLIHQGLNL